jgi:hypothetical protein
MSKRGRGRPAPPLRIGQILAWADRHRRRAGRWPTAASGPVAGAPGETWSALDKALRRGGRGLPDVESLSRLLRRERGLPERRGRRAQSGRWRQAELLRARGLTLAQIGRRLGVSPQRAHQLLRRAREECPPAQGYRTQKGA